MVTSDTESGLSGGRPRAGAARRGFSMCRSIRIRIPGRVLMRGTYNLRYAQEVAGVIEQRPVMTETKS